MENLEKRMYGFVPYNLSEIQKGIQFGHAVVEYELETRDSFHKKNLYRNWAEQYKTFVILNGGTTNSSQTKPGNMNKLLFDLRDTFPELHIGTFYEEDLGRQLTAFCFIIDERVYNYEKYPESSELYDIGGNSNIKMRHILEKYKLA